MPRNADLIKKRNEHIVKRFNYYKKKNPKFLWYFWVKDVADEMFLSTSTVGKIILSHGEDLPCVDTISKFDKQFQDVA